jgi:hypothetical protein
MTSYPVTAHWGCGRLPGYVCWAAGGGGTPKKCAILCNCIAAGEINFFISTILCVLLTKIDFNKKSCANKHVSAVDMAQDRDRWRAVVSAVMNLWVP